jgi:hypothetical protein
MATDCILTYIDQPYRPSSLNFDFDLDIADGGGAGFLTIDFGDYMDEDFRIVGVEERDGTDLKCTSIVADPSAPDQTIIYTFDTTSTYWDYKLREDLFTVSFKDMVTSEIAIVTIGIRAIDPQAFGADSPSNPWNIDVKYPYPERLFINMDDAWSSVPTYITYKLGNTDPEYVAFAQISEENDNEIIIDLPDLAKQAVTTTIKCYMANKSALPVDEESDTINVAELSLNFQT